MEEKLIEKLKLNKFVNIEIINSAKEEDSAFDGYVFPKEVTGKLDLAIAYIYSLEEMKNIFFESYNKELISENGQLYLIYPKMKNKLGHTPIHRDSIFPFLQVNEDDVYVKGADYKFNRMLALDENYTLVAVKYLPKSKAKTSNRPSARVRDYIDRIKDLEDFLAKYPKELELFKSLTPGSQRDWARHVYSAKKIETQQKRLYGLLGELRGPKN